MQKTMTLGLLAAATLLSACTSGSLLNRARPDEMAVTRAAPLLIPPDFALTPPAPGAPANAESASEQTLRALFGGAAPRSPTETSLLDRAGANRADPGIRSVVGDPGTFIVDKGTVTRDILVAPAGAGQFAQAVAGTRPGG